MSYELTATQTAFDLRSPKCIAFVQSSQLIAHSIPRDYRPATSARSINSTRSFFIFACAPLSMYTMCPDS